MEFKSCFPAEVRLLSEGHLRSWNPINVKRATWFIDIVGPFCWVNTLTKNGYYNCGGYTERLASQLSAVMCLPVNITTVGTPKTREISITVLIDDSTRNELIRREYEALTKSRPRR